jgi:hypothetical protein
LLPRVEDGHRGRNGKRHLAVSPTRNCFDLRVQPSKRDDYTLTRQTSQQEEAQKWHRSTFWSRLVTRRKLIATLLLSVTSRTQEKSWWTCAKAPCPYDEMVSPVLSHRLITNDLFLPHDCQIYSKPGELVFLAHLQLCRCQTRIHRATSKDILRGETSSGWCRHEDVSQVGPYCEGTT